MRVYLMVVPCDRAFADMDQQYMRVLKKTHLDHTDLLELCFAHWNDISELTHSPNESQRAYLHGLLEDHISRVLKRRYETFEESVMTTSDLMGLLEVCYQNLEGWLDLAVKQFHIKQLQSVRAKRFMSSRAVLTELVS